MILDIIHNDDEHAARTRQDFMSKSCRNLPLCISFTITLNAKTVAKRSMMGKVLGRARCKMRDDVQSSRQFTYRGDNVQSAKDENVQSMRRQSVRRWAKRLCLDAYHSRLC